MSLPDYVAFKKPGDDFFTWCDRAAFPAKPSRKLTEDEKKRCTEIQYTASGKLTMRPDGAIAEIWVPVNETQQGDAK